MEQKQSKSIRKNLCKIGNEGMKFLLYKLLSNSIKEKTGKVNIEKLMKNYNYQETY